MVNTPSTLTNPTVLITGASSGIGYELAISYAKRHYNLIIIGRNKEALATLAESCQQQYQVTVHTIVQDLTQENAAKIVFEQLKTQNFKIEILINNAGVGLWGNYIDADPAAEHQLVQLHISFLLAFTRLILQQMRTRRSGKIINIGSVYCYTPVPKQSVYAASKAFLASFSDALRIEVAPYDIEVCLVCPGITHTKFRSRAHIDEKKTWWALEASEVAEQIVEGAQKGSRYIVPGLFNKIYISIGKHLSTRIIEWLIYSVRGLKIKEKEH